MTNFIHFLNALLIAHTSNFHHTRGINTLYDSIRHDFTVAEGTSRQRLDQFLVTLLPQLSRSYIGDLVEKGFVEVDEVKRSKNYKVSPGESITVSIASKDVSTVKPENIPLDILFEDDHIIAINKPPGMVVHPAPGSPNGTFVNALLYYLGDDASRDLLKVPSLKLDTIIDDEDEESHSDISALPSDSTTSSRPGIVHRLDKGTSGVLLAAKHPEALTKLAALFSSRKIRKLYLAVCVGNPGEATVVEPIGRCKVNRQLMTTYDGPPGKSSTTHLRTIAFDGKLSAVLARIETGRTHQIRVHLKYRRTPVLGDVEYGTVEWNKKYAKYSRVTRPLLHAYETQFVHPFTGEDIVIRAPVPKDIAGMLAQLTAPTFPLLDAASLLIGSTEVVGKLPGEANRGLTALDSIRMDEVK